MIFYVFCVLKDRAAFSNLSSIKIISSTFNFMKILTVKDLKVKFKDREVLSGVDFEADAGALAAISGRTGSGKTTLLSIISGLLRPDSGEVLFRGKNIFKWGDIRKSRYRNRKIGYVFQSFNLLPDLTVYDNIAYPAILNYRFRGMGREIKRLLHVLDIEAIKNSCPAALSGGEKQRVAIARALINRPEIIIADEPTGNLDSETAASIFRMLSNIKTKEGITVIFATHDRDIIKNSDIHYRLDEGRLVQQ